MKPVLQIAPLALLFSGAVIGVWRGFKSKHPDNTVIKLKDDRKKRSKE